MIITELKQLPGQIKMSPEFETAMNFLQRDDLDRLEPGRLELDGERVYAMIQSAFTKPVEDVIKLEGHKKYIDIHYLPLGMEIIGWADAAGLEAAGSYDQDHDRWYASLPVDQVTLVKMKAGQIMVCYPPDLHAPQLLETPGLPLRKIVMKVRVG